MIFEGQPITGPGDQNKYNSTLEEVGIEDTATVLIAVKMIGGIWEKWSVIIWMDY